MKDFKFQKFTLIQNPDVFRVGTDAVLLGALSSCENASQILEIGCGTGIVALMLAQRNPKAHILALDIDEKAVDLAELNFKNSVFSNRLETRLADFKNYGSPNYYDLIISNPPFFEINDSSKDILARQKRELDFSQLVKNTSTKLSEKGVFSVIIPKLSEEEFCEICEKNQLYIFRKILIKGIENAEVKRVVLEFSKEKRELKEENFVIEKSPRIYSEQYLELTKEFHVFTKK